MLTNTISLTSTKRSICIWINIFIWIPSIRINLFWIFEILFILKRPNKSLSINKIKNPFTICKKAFFTSLYTSSYHSAKQTFCCHYLEFSTTPNRFMFQTGHVSDERTRLQINPFEHRAETSSRVRSFYD